MNSQFKATLHVSCTYKYETNNFGWPPENASNFIMVKEKKISIYFGSMGSFM